MTQRRVTARVPACPGIEWLVILASSKASYITSICMSMDGALNPIAV